MAAPKHRKVLDADATSYDLDNKVHTLITSANTVPTDLDTFTNVKEDQTIKIIGGSSTNATTITNAGKFKLKGNITLTQYTMIRLYVCDLDTYIEETRSEK